MFYDRFSELCSNAGITPYRFSSMTGIGQSTIAMWKKNGAIPHGETLQKIADFFSVSTDYLLTGEDKVVRQAEANDNFTFYDRFVELCNEKGVAPTRAVLDMGMSKALPATWKNNGSTPQAAQLNKIAAYFGVSADYLLTGEENEKAPSEKGEDATSDDIKLALFGGDGEVTDEMWEEAKFAIELIKNRHRKKLEKGEGSVSNRAGKEHQD